MISITKHDIGRPVIYRTASGDTVELGYIFGLPPEGAFVVYPPNPQPKLAQRRDLEFVERGFGGTGTKEERARAYCAAVLEDTTLPPERHTEAVELLWYRFQPLIAMDEESPTGDHAP